MLAVVNVHLRAPLAASVAGQKLEPFVWKSVGGWAEGYLFSAMRRAAQALEVRLLLEELLDADEHRQSAVAGDFNAEDHEVPLRIILGAEEEPATADCRRAPSCFSIGRCRATAAGASCIMADPRCSTTSLASRALHESLRSIEVHNETLADELVGYAKHLQSSSILPRGRRRRVCAATEG